MDDLFSNHYQFKIDFEYEMIDLFKEDYIFNVIYKYSSKDEKIYGDLRLIPKELKHLFV